MFLIRASVGSRYVQLKAKHENSLSTADERKRGETHVAINIINVY